MGKEKIDKLVIGLIIVIVLLLGILAYVFLINPAINGFVVQEQNKGVQYGAQYAVATIMQQAAQCPSGGVPLTLQNQTIHIVALECPQPASK